MTWAFQPDALYGHAAAALGYMSFLSINEIYRALRHRNGLGEGDAKLFAAAGAWLGLAARPYVVLGAGAIGIAMAVLSMRSGGLRGDPRIAFGPALALSFFLWRLAGG